MTPRLIASLLTAIGCLPGMAAANPALAAGQPMDLTLHWVGLFALSISVIAYLVVVLEEGSNCASPSR